MHPVSRENGDPGSPFPYEMRDPGPQFSNILGTLGSPILYDIRDPSMKSGTPMEFFFVLLNLAITMHAINNVGHFNNIILVNLHFGRAKYNITMRVIVNKDHMSTVEPHV